MRHKSTIEYMIMHQQRSALSRIFGGLFWGMNKLRVIFLNVIFFIFLFAFLGALMSKEKPRAVVSGSALLVAPEGLIVEELAGDPAEVALNKALGDGKPEVLLRDIVTAIQRAKDDPRVPFMVLDPSAITGVSLNKLQAIRAAVEDFKQSGKKVIAISEAMSQGQYYFAAMADEVLMHPEGVVFMDGFGSFRTYYKGALDKIGADVRLIRVGTYKSYGEPYIRNDMSDAAKEENLDWMGDLWHAYLTDIAAMRGKTAEQLQANIVNMSAQLEAVHGDLAQLALKNGLVDKLMSRQQMRDYLISLGQEDRKLHSYRRIGVDDYLAATRKPSFPGSGGDKIAVVVARGAITGGDQPPGTVGGDSTSKLLRKARFDDAVKAVVLVIDSPGGAVFASELIRREVQNVRDAGKPVVVSMSGVVVSGGYWIGMNANQIWASPTTITGSIGIFGLYPSFAGSIHKLGLNVDGVGTTPLAGAQNLLRPIDENLVGILNHVIKNGYLDFITKVAQARGMTPDAVDHIAQGRVWSGRKALDLGLVDHLGNFDDAVNAAAGLAGLEAGKYKLDYVTKELSRWQQLVVQMAGEALLTVGLDTKPQWAELPLARVLNDVRGDMALLLRGKQYSINAYCFCTVQWR